MMCLLAFCLLMGSSAVGQSKPEPRIMCPANASKVELPAAYGVRVLRCVDDTDGQPNGLEIWLAANGNFVQRGSWDRGIRSGLWERWYTSGHLMSRIAYEGGQIVNASCMSEQKRKTFDCTPDYYPADWTPPPVQDTVPAAEPAGTGAAPSPAPGGSPPPEGAPPSPPPATTP